MDGVRGVHGCDVGTAAECIAVSAAMSSGLSTSSTAVNTSHTTDNTDKIDPAGSRTIAVSAASSAITAVTESTVDNSADTASSLDTLQAPVDAVPLVTESTSGSSSAIEPSTAQSPFRFSAARCNFQKYTAMVNYFTMKSLYNKLTFLCIVDLDCGYCKMHIL